MANMVSSRGGPASTQKDSAKGAKGAWNDLRCARWCFPGFAQDKRKRRARQAQKTRKTSAKDAQDKRNIHQAVLGRPLYPVGL
jgi:hypothetical protein